MIRLLAQISTKAADKGLTSLASGDYGVLGIILAIVLVCLIVFGIFYVRSTQVGLSSKAQRDELQDMLKQTQDSNIKLVVVIDEKDEIIKAKDAEIQRLNEDRVSAAKTGTEAVIKSTESMTGMVPVLQNITGQLQQLLARGA